MFESITRKEVTGFAQQDPVNSVAFSPDGQFLALASVNAALVSPLSPRAIVDYVCTRLPFNLTLEECEQYLPGEPCHKTCPNLP